MTHPPKLFLSILVTSILLLPPSDFLNAEEISLIYYNPDNSQCYSGAIWYYEYAVKLSPSDFTEDKGILITHFITRAGIENSALVPARISDVSPMMFPDSSVYEQTVRFSDAGWDTFELTEPLPWDGDVWVSYEYATIPIPFALSTPDDTTQKRNLVRTDFGWTFAGCEMAIGLIVETPTGMNDGHPRPPASFQLSQNYPNPFNPTTTITFSLSVPSHVELSIYNLRGRLITTIVDKPLSAGVHSVVWRGSEHPSGTYIYQIRAGESVVRKKMLISK